MNWTVEENETDWLGTTPMQLKEDHWEMAKLFMNPGQMPT